MDFCELLSTVEENNINIIDLPDNLSCSNDGKVIIICGHQLVISNDNIGYLEYNDEGEYKYNSNHNNILEIINDISNIEYCEELIEYIKSKINRKNCDNKPSEYIEALCHIIPDMKTIKDIPENKHEKLIISDKNFKKYLDNISKDKQNYVELIRTKYEYITKYGLNKDIEYIYIPGKFNDENIIPQEIKNLINNYDLKENKSDYYIKFKNDNKPYGFSVKDDNKSTKTNYSVQKCIEYIDLELSKMLTLTRQNICKENGVYNGKENDPNSARNNEKRKILNNTFKRGDLYHTTINTFIIWNIEYVKDYIVNNMYSVNVNYPLYECIKGEIFNINKNDIIESTLESFPEAELKLNGEERDIAKLFYKLTIKFSDCTKKYYRIETRTKGNWWSASIQFQSHLI
jgi:hypothetical protein